MAFNLRKVRSDSDALNRVQDAVGVEFSKLNRNPFIEGALLEGVALGTGDTNVSHGLGRAVSGYLVVKRSSAGVVSDGATASTRPELWVTLRASVSGTFSLWVF